MSKKINTIIRLAFVGWLSLWTSSSSYSQSVDCRTIGVEAGTFGGWERWTGEVSPYIFPLTHRLQPGSLHELNGQYGHTITRLEDGYDPNVRARLPVVAPGSQHSVRIGDLEAGGYVDHIRTTFVVAAEKPLLRYQLAVVLQNPRHQPDQQPGFSFLIRTLAGDTIRCGYYEAVASNQTAGFTHQEPDGTFDRLLYRNWTSHVLDLRDYVGQTLRLEVTAHDCTEGGHYGYAYFDAQCLAMSLQATTSCTPQGTTMTLAVPTGFDRYQWNTGDTTASIRVSPQLGAVYWVDVESASVLNPACKTALRLRYQVNQLLIPTSQQVTLCAGESYRVGDSLYTQSGTYRQVIHRPPLCDSVLITELTILPSPHFVQRVTLCQGDYLVVGDSLYRTPGSYQTRIQRAAPLCDSVVTTHLSIRPIEIEPLRDTLIMLGDSIQLSASVPIGANYAYSWSPPSGLSCPSCPITWARPNQTTRYALTVRIPNTDCQADYALEVGVLACSLAVPSSFTPNGDGMNDSFELVVNPCLGRLRQLSIYNRWGQVVFHGELTAGWEKRLRWDGTYQGERVQAGVYGYQLTLIAPTGETRQHTGSVTLIR